MWNEIQPIPDQMELNIRKLKIMALVLKLETCNKNTTKFGSIFN